jgi:hypothetical protein
MVLERDAHGVSPHFTMATNRRVESLYPYRVEQSSESSCLPFPSSHSRAFLLLHGVFDKHRSVGRFARMSDPIQTAQCLERFFLAEAQRLQVGDTTSAVNAYHGA